MKSIIKKNTPKVAIETTKPNEITLTTSKILDQFQQNRIDPQPEIPAFKNIESRIVSPEEEFHQVKEKMLDFLKHLKKTVRNLDIDIESPEQLFKSLRERSNAFSLKTLVGTLVRDDDGGLVGTTYENTGIVADCALDAALNPHHNVDFWGKEVSYSSIGTNRSWFAVKDQVYHIAIVGSTQSGKTAVITLIYCLDTIMTFVLSNGTIKKCPILMVPADHSLRLETMQALDAVRKAYGDIVFTNKQTGFSATLNDYWEIMKADKIINHPDDLVVIRSSKALDPVKGVRNIWTRAIAEKYTPIAYLDEPDHGSGYGSIQDQATREFTIKAEEKENSLPDEQQGYSLDEEDEKEKEERNDIELISLIIKDIETIGGPFSIVTIGATCPEQTSGNTDYKFILIPMVLPPKYVGASAYDGNPLPYLKGYVPREVNVQDIDSYLQKQGVWEVPMSGPFLSKGNIEIQKKKALSIANIAVKNYTTNNGFTVFRPESNKAGDQFIKLMKKINPSIVCKAFYSDLSEDDRTIKRICKRSRKDKKITIIVVTGRAKRGTPFPSDCTLFVDITKGTSTPQATFIQNFKGRASGIKDNVATVLLSRKLADLNSILQSTNYTFAETEIITGIPIHWRVELGSEEEIEVESLDSTIRSKKAGKKSAFCRVFRSYDEVGFTVLESNWETDDNENSLRPTRGDNKDNSYIYNDRNKNWMKAVRFLENISLKIRGGIYLIDEPMGNKKFSGNVTFRWFKDEEDWQRAKTAGGNKPRVQEKTDFPFQFGCYIKSKLCPVCGKDIQKTIKGYIEHLRTQSGYFTKEMLKLMHDNNEECCWYNSSITICYILVYTKEQLFPKERELTGQENSKNDTRSIESGWARASHENNPPEDGGNIITMGDELIVKNGKVIQNPEIFKSKKPNL